MMDVIPVPRCVAEDVDRMLAQPIREHARYENREAFDESDAAQFHELAARIYAAGWADGEQVARCRRHVSRVRLSWQEVAS